MTRVRPFRAYTFARASVDVSDLVAPPYDVISERERARLLARHATNVVGLELPEGSLEPSVPGNRYETGRKRWREWRDSGVVSQDRLPALYAFEQHFESDGARFRRRAIIGEVTLHAFAEGIILPHERTLPKALGDRFNLTKACAANFSPVFGLFSDPAKATDPFFDAAMQGPARMTATNGEGVVSNLWAVTDAELIDSVATVLATKQIFIADGHHRYTTALAYRDERRAQDRSARVDPVDPPYDAVMMALVNMDDPGLVVLPTHRLATAPGAFDAATFLRRLGETFALTETTPDRCALELESAQGPAFAFGSRHFDSVMIATLRDDTALTDGVLAKHSRAWAELDVTVLQELVLDPLLGIHPDRAETLERLTFVKDADEAWSNSSMCDVVFILRATRVDQLRAVALAGDMMPQKSTYFYPKIPSGFVMRGMD